MFNIYIKTTLNISRLVFGCNIQYIYLKMRNIIVMLDISILQYYCFTDAPETETCIMYTYSYMYTWLNIYTILHEYSLGVDRLLY